MVRGLAPDRFHIEAITAGIDDKVCWQFPENVVRLRRIPLWGRTDRIRPAGQMDKSIRQVLSPFLMSIHNGHADTLFLPSLRTLARFARQGVLAEALCSNEAIELAIDAMRFPQWSLISAKGGASHVLRHFDAAAGSHHRRCGPRSQVP